MLIHEDYPQDQERVSLARHESSYLVKIIYKIKIAFSSAIKTIERADNAIIYESRTMFCQRVSFRIEELDLHAYRHQDPERETKEHITWLFTAVLSRRGKI